MFIADIIVTPGAKKERCIVDTQGRIKWYVCAPPEGGKANAALVEAMAKKIGCARNAITIVAGNTSRHKRVSCATINSRDELLKCLGLYDEVYQCRM